MQGAVERAGAAATVERAEILAAPGPRRPRALTGPQKAAVAVRMLLAEGIRLPLAALPEPMQTALTEQMGRMRLVDRATRDAVAEELIAALDAVGLACPGGLDGALGLLDGQISAAAAARLRRLAGNGGRADPWERVVALPAARLLPILERESLEVGAVVLSKLEVGRAAELLERLPGERARRLAHAMSRTGRVDPETVRRIGLALAQQIDAETPPAFAAGPVARVAAILNSAPEATRAALLAALAETDPDFAAEVRREIFTFAHVPERLAPRDVPQVLREVPQPVLLRALVAAVAAGGAERAAAEFLLAGTTQRMAEGLRAEMAEHPAVEPRAGEAAMAEVVAAIRRLVEAGAVALQARAAGDAGDAGGS